MSEKKTVVVHIGGQRFAIKTDADERYLEALAEFVEEKLAQVQDASQLGSSYKKAILAALNIADELFRDRIKTERLKENILLKSKSILAAIDKEARRIAEDKN